MTKLGKNSKPVSWMDAADIESRLVRLDATQLTEAFARVRDSVAEQIVRNRNEEGADFSEARHHIVRYESR